MNRADITFYLSILGSITGVIAVIVTVLNMIFNAIKIKQDGAKLKILTIIDYKINFDLHKKKEIIASSLGKKQIYFDNIEYYVIPETFIKNLFKCFLYKKDRYIYHQSISNVILSEGQKVTLEINLPKGLDLSEICKVKIVDQTGRKWKVTWPPTRYLKDYNKKENIYTTGKENSNYKLTVEGNKVWNFYCIKTTLTEKKHMGETQYSIKRFSSKFSYEEEIKQLLKEGIDKILEKGL
jgi:hypothetical protein